MENVIYDSKTSRTKSILFYNNYFFKWQYTIRNIYDNKKKIIVNVTSKKRSLIGYYA